MEDKPKNNFATGKKWWHGMRVPNSARKYDCEGLITVFKEYMDDNETRSWAKDDFIKSGPDAGKVVTIKIPNPPSIMGFCLFAGITEQTFNNYRKPNDSCFEAACAVDYGIKMVQIGGAAANVFNANIVARIAQLIDKREVDIKTELSDDERAEAIKKILENAPRKSKYSDDELM